MESSSARSLPSAPPAFALPLTLLLPTLLAFNVTPVTTLLNVVLAVIGWGAMVLLHASRLSAGFQLRAVWPLLLALALYGLGVGLSVLGGLPLSLGLQAWGFLCVCGILAALASQAQALPGALASGEAKGDQRLLAEGMLFAAVPSAVIALIQVFEPTWADGTFIVQSHLPGRAVGNFRQPNHLALLLLWGLAAWVPVAQAGRWFGGRFPWAAALALAAFLLLALVLSGSRTGMLGILALALWGAMDGRLARRVRWSMALSPLVFGMFWALMVGWSQETHQIFGAQERLGHTTLANVSSSRFLIWGDVWSLIAANPWSGVGFGRLNFAWTLSVFPGRHPSYLDNAHNLPLQLAVELGLPFAALVISALGWAFWLAAKRAFAVPGEAGVASRCAWVMLLMVGLHSLLEYPLWYGYFLLPTAWIWGLCLRLPAERQTPNGAAAAIPRMVFMFLGVLLVGGGLGLYRDHRLVSDVFMPSNVETRQARIEAATQSVLFRHHAAYGELMNADPPSRDPSVWRLSTQALLDAPLMIAWAEALAESGQVDKAKYLAERLKEFHHIDEQADRFFATCRQVTVTVEPPPFQCLASKEPHTWRDFLE